MVTDDVFKRRGRSGTATFIVKFRHQYTGPAGQSEHHDASKGDASRVWRVSIEHVETGERRYCETFNCIEEVFGLHGFTRPPVPAPQAEGFWARLLGRLAVLLHRQIR